MTIFIHTQKKNKTGKQFLNNLQVITFFKIVIYNTNDTYYYYIHRKEYLHSHSNQLVFIIS